MAAPPDLPTRRGWDPPQPRPRRRRWPWVLLALVVASIVIGSAGSMVRLPYYTIAPGDALDVNDLVTLDGARQYRTDDELLLLFIRQRARVNVWRWIQASLDPDIDLFKEEEFTGGISPDDVRTQSSAEMALSQLAAKRVALEAVGYEVGVRPGAEVIAVYGSMPAAGVLQEGDAILGVDGVAAVDVVGLSELIRSHSPGDALTVRLERDGTEREVEVGTVAGDDGRPVLGVSIAPRFAFPVDVTIDTGRIGGPSAGLAMTLSVIDALTPGDLTGGLTVAVTGTIDLDGRVGVIGGLGQKSLTARAAGATVFLVPADEAADARSRADDSLKVVGVRTLDDALRALEDAGGDPIEQVGRVAVAAA